MILIPSEWKVPMKGRRGVESSESVLSLISRAARFVNVTAIMPSGLTPWSTRYAILWTMVRVFPVPGPATTSTGPSRAVTAFL